jgi:preprotein translocase subunit SecF
MKTRVAIVAALLTVLASSCNNKVWIDCPTTTVTRTKNRALTAPQVIVDHGQTEALTC